MTKTSKITFSLALFLVAFVGEGRAQETPCIIQQCMVNCYNTFYSPVLSCMENNPSNPAICIPTQTDITTLGNCINSPTYYGDSCPSNSTTPTKSSYIAQATAVTCFNTFQASFNACAPGASGFGCVAKAVGALATCITNIPANQGCTVP